MHTQTFDDFDAFSDSVRDIECAMMLLRNPEQRLWTIDVANAGDMEVQLGRLGSGNIAQGQIRTDGYLLYTPLTRGVAYRANGELVDENSVIVMPPGKEFCISTKVSHDWCAVFVPGRHMENRSPNHTQPDEDETGLRVVNLKVGSAARLRWLTDQIMTAAKVESQFESSPAAVGAGRALFEMAAHVIGDRPAAEVGRRDGRPSIPRSQIIRRSLELLEVHSVSSLSVSDLSRLVGVSERTLRTAFNEYFAMGPTRYLQLRRLHNVRRALTAADSAETSVSKVLSAHGEWAFGRVAAKYAKLFGESPSETLHRAKR